MSIQQNRGRSRNRSRSRKRAASRNRVRSQSVPRSRGYIDPEINAEFEKTLALEERAVALRGPTRGSKRQRRRVRRLRRNRRVQRNFMETYDSKMDINHAWFDYLRTLAQPMKFPNVRIPDISMFPCATIQTLTRGIVNSGGLGKGMIICYPQLHQSINIFSGATTVYPSGDAYPTLTIDGVVHTPDPSAPDPTADVHNYAALVSTISMYRVVSGCLHLEYIGSELNNSGECALACTPPTPDDEVLTTFDELADYNYSVTTTARDGGWQVWFPLGSQSGFAQPVDAEAGTNTFPPLQFGFQGLPLDVDVFKFTVCWNIEAYSNDQLLTANAVAGKPDAFKQSVSLSAVASHGASKGLGGPASSSEIDWKGIVNTGVKLLSEYGPSIATAVGAFL